MILDIQYWGQIIDTTVNNGLLDYLTSGSHPDKIGIGKHCTSELSKYLYVYSNKLQLAMVY